MTYQLIQVPSTNAHVTLLVIHALAEASNVILTRSVVLPGVVGRVGLPQSAVHGLGVRGSGLLLGLSRSTGASTEETTDGMSDGRTDSHTTVIVVSNDDCLHIQISRFGKRKEFCHLRCGRCHLPEEPWARRALLRLRRRLLGMGLLVMGWLVSSSRVRLVLLLGLGSRSRARRSGSRPGGSAAGRSSRGGGTTTLTRHVDDVLLSNWVM